MCMRDGLNTALQRRGIRNENNRWESKDSLYVDTEWCYSSYNSLCGDCSGNGVYSYMDSWAGELMIDIDDVLDFILISCIMSGALLYITICVSFMVCLVSLIWCIL